MKIHKNTSKSSTILFSSIFLAIFLLSSCSKPSVNYVNQPVVAGLAIIQASPDQPPADLFITNQRANNVPILYGQSFDYFTVPAGTDPVSFVNDATQKSIVADSVQFIQNRPYSLFFCNTVSSPQLFLLADTLAAPGSGMSSVRFVNVSPDAGPVDLVIKSGATITANKSFKGHSSFSTLPANIQYTFEVHQAGTATVLATVTSKFNPGFIYTVWFHGLTAGTAGKDALAADIFINGYFQ